MFGTKFLSLFFLSVLTFCGNLLAQTEKTSLQIEKNYLSVTLKKSDCDADCSVYNLSIQPNGNILFEGISMTKVKGKIESSLSETKLDQLINEIVKADFFSLKNFYTYESKNCPWIMLDRSTIILSINLNGKKKTITHYLGCAERNEPETALKPFPQQLYNLENRIDEIIETKRWIGERK